MYVYTNNTIMIIMQIIRLPLGPADPGLPPQRADPHAGG